MNNEAQNEGKIIRIDDSTLKNHVSELVRGTVEETLNNLLDAEADKLCGAKRYEHSENRKDTRAGSYNRKLLTKAGEVTVKMPKLRHLKMETSIIERYKRRESSIEEAMIEMYLAGVSVRRVEDITEALWGTKVSPSTISNLNKKIYSKIEAWRNRPLSGRYPYVYLDGIVLKRSWGGEYRNVSVLVAIAVSEYGYREVIGVAEGAKEDKTGWYNFIKSLKQRGLKGVKLIVSDKCLGLVESATEIYPAALWQRCIVHFYRNVFSKVPRQKTREVSEMLKAIHAMESIDEAREKAQRVVVKLKLMRLKKAAKCVETGIEETLTYFNFPGKHKRRIRTNNPLERIMREIRRRTRVVGAFPDGESALMLVGARLRHIAGTKWGSKRYLNMELLKEMEVEKEYQESISDLI